MVFWDRYFIILRKYFRTFLVVQWLKLHAPNAEGPGLIPGQGTRSHISQLKIPHTATKKKKIPYAQLIKVPACLTKTEDPACHTKTLMCLPARLLQLCPTLCNTMDYIPARLLCPQNSPGKNTGMDCHALLQRILLSQGD